MNFKLLLVIAWVSALMAGCGKAAPQDKGAASLEAVSTVPLASSSEPYYDDPEYILDATVTTQSVEASVKGLTSSVKLDPSKTYKVEVKIYESK